MPRDTKLICRVNNAPPVYLATKIIKGHPYDYVLEAHRMDNRLRPYIVLYLGRLDRLTPERRVELEHKVRALHNDALLYAFYARLARLGQPVPRSVPVNIQEQGPFPLSPVTFATLCDGLREEDLMPRDLAALVTRIGVPVSVDGLEAISVRVDGGKKTRSISLYYRPTSPHLLPTARPATGSSRQRRRSAAGSAPSVRP